jgi:hypothetical protein
MRSRPWQFPVATLVAGSLLAVPSSSLGAQAPAAGVAGRAYVQVIRLRPEMATEWENLQRTEVVPALKKGGQATRTVLRTQVGNAFEYVVLNPFPLWGGFDTDNAMTRALGAAGAQALQAKLRRCIQTQSSYMATRDDSLSLAAADAGVVRTTVRRFLPGKRGEYETLIRAEVLPAMRKAREMGKLAGYTYMTRGVGAAANEFTETEHFTKFADLDGGNPLALALGGTQAANALNAKRTALATTMQVVVRRRVADLSF